MKSFYVEEVSQPLVISNYYLISDLVCRSTMFLQMHCDVLGVPIIVNRKLDNAPLLGSGTDVYTTL